jgi:RNase P subunit RPR2
MSECLRERIEEIIPSWCSNCARYVTNGAVLLYRVGSACRTVVTCITSGQIRENSRTDSEMGLYEFRKTADLWKPKWNALN